MKQLTRRIRTKFRRLKRSTFNSVARTRFKFVGALPSRDRDREVRKISSKRLEYTRGRRSSFEVASACTPVISITTYPKRFPLALKTLTHLRRYIPRGTDVILYLNADEIAENTTYDELEIESLISRLSSLAQLEIRGERAGPYGKFVWALEDYFDRNIITLDDDCYYHPKSLRSLIALGSDRCRDVISLTGRQIKYRLEESGEEFRPSRVDPLYLNAVDYSQWPLLTPRTRSENKGSRLMLRGVGGIVYPAGISMVVPDLRNLSLAMSLSPFNDDLFVSDVLWRAGQDLRVLGGPSFTPIMAPGRLEGLESLNVSGGRNNLHVAQLTDNRTFGFPH